MKFFTIFSSLLVSSVVALPAPSQVQTRDSDINTSLNNLIQGLKDFNKTVTGFNPAGLTTVGGLLDVLNESNKLGDDIIAATKASNNSQQLNDDDSLQVVQTVLALYPDIQSVLKNVEATRSKFDSVAILLSVRKTVLSALQNDNTLAQQLGAALVPKLQPNYASAGPYVLKQIQDAFDSAIKNYSQSKKGIELPAIPSKVKNGKVTNL